MFIETLIVQKIDQNSMRRTAFLSATKNDPIRINAPNEAQALARHSNPELTANTYGRARNERLAQVTETVANRLLFGQTGANMVHEAQSEETGTIVKLLPEQQLINNSGQWRRGDSNPRPEMFQGKRLHA
jgi:hypothetical protein